MAIVQLDNVGKTYPGGVDAVRGVSIQIADGEFLVLVGPSGCGKSTTLRMVAGLETVTSGSIRIAERVVNDVAPKDRDIAMVFQSYALYPHMSVRKNLAFALRLRRLPSAEIDRRVSDAAELLGLTDMLDRRPAHLSGGQRQRVAVGRAIVREPAVYLFDEPLSNLDAKLRATMRTELKALHQRLRTTTIYVTHDQEEAMSLGDRIVVMDGGTVQQVGTPMDVYQRPSTRFVASFIGSPHMNFFEGTVRRRGEAWVFHERAGQGEAQQPIAVDLPASLSGRFTLSQDRPMTLGVRPQHFKPLKSATTPGFACVRTTVRSVDPLGEDADIVFQTPTNERAISRMKLDSEVRADDPLTLAVDPALVHLFEAEGDARAIA